MANAKQSNPEPEVEKTVAEEIEEIHEDVRGFIERAKNVAKSLSKEEIGVFLGFAVLELAATISRNSPADDDEEEEEDEGVGYGG